MPGIARIVRKQPREVALAALLVLGGGALVLAGPDGSDQTARPALIAGSGPGDPVLAVPSGMPTSSQPARAASPVAASSLDSLSGASGLDAVDLIGKGLVVAALLYLTLRMLARLQAEPAAGSRLMDVLETRPLGPKASLHLVAIGDRRLVVGLTPGGMVALADLEAALLTGPAVAPEASGSVGTDVRAPHATALAPSAASGAVALLRTVARNGWLVARQVVAGGTNR